MELVAPEIEPFHFPVWNLGSRGVEIDPRFPRQLSVIFAWLCRQSYSRSHCRLVSGCPRQFLLMKADRQCSILFHLLARQKVTYGNGESGFIGQRLQFQLEQTQRDPLCRLHRRRYSSGGWPGRISPCP